MCMMIVTLFARMLFIDPANLTILQMPQIRTTQDIARDTYNNLLRNKKKRDATAFLKSLSHSVDVVNGCIRSKPDDTCKIEICKLTGGSGKAVSIKIKETGKDYSVKLRSSFRCSLNTFMVNDYLNLMRYEDVMSISLLRSWDESQ